MIAAVAARNGASILAHDRDFARVARVLGIDLEAESLIRFLSRADRRYSGQDER